MYKFDATGERLEQAGNTDNNILFQNKYSRASQRVDQHDAKKGPDEKTTFQTLYDVRQNKLDEDNKEDQLFGVDVA